MGQRLQLHEILKQFTGNVYFQPPENIRISYPCIIYARDFVATDHADNQPYGHRKRYMVTIIDRDPDSGIPDQVASLSTSAFNRAYVADGLHHDVYTVYF